MATDEETKTMAGVFENKDLALVEIKKIIKKYKEFDWQVNINSITLNSDKHEFDTLDNEITIKYFAIETSSPNNTMHEIESTS
jgi:hypothetical protein